MPVKNAPRQQETPAPRYANDPTGFWSANAAANERQWQTILPNGTIIAMDRQVAREILRKAVSWVSVIVKWNNIQFSASLDDSQAMAPLESGGLGSSGQVTLVFLKSLFSVGGAPVQHDTFQLLVAGAWKNFQVISISESFDEADDAMIAYCEPEDSSQ